MRKLAMACTFVFMARIARVYVVFLAFGRLWTSKEVRRGLPVDRVCAAELDHLTGQKVRLQEVLCEISSAV